MASRILGLGAAILLTGGLPCTSSQALADDSAPTAGRPDLSTGPGLQVVPLLPRGHEEFYAGDPTCIPLVNNMQVSIDSGFQECGDGLWVSLAYPVRTEGATIGFIKIIHNTNTGEGDLYLMGDCGGNPDVNNVLWNECGCIQGAVGGAVTYYCVSDSIVDPPPIVWVVAVFRDSLAFDIAFDCAMDGPGHGYSNVVGSGNCGDWSDLDNFAHGDDCNPGGTLGGCAWVSLEAPPHCQPLCCDSPALCDGDVNGDGYVDPLDMGAILSRFGLDASEPANCPYDVNCDGLIDPLDSGYILARFSVCNEPVRCPIGGGPPDECGVCPGGTYCGPQCGAPPAADCCEVHLAPGCDAVCGVPDDGGVEQCVCDFDDFCCTVTWDSVCVEFVEQLGCADCSETNPDCVE